MAVDITLWWRAYGSADANTDYKIYSDKATSGTMVLLTTEDAADRGDGNYYPYTSTLAADIAKGATSIDFTGVTGFNDGDRVKIEGETFVVDGLSGTTFGDCTPGADNTLQYKHDAAATIYQMHETYTDSAVDFGSRHAIRYQVVVALAGGDLVAAECVAVNPTPPPTNDFCTVWGILDSTQGSSVVGNTVTLQIADGDNYNPRTAETYETGTISTTTDGDGYWELFFPRDVAHLGGDVLRLTVNGENISIASIPDQDTICYLELV